MGDEVNLREYVDVLLRRWKVIVIITSVAVFVSSLVSFLSPDIYEAEARVLITQARSEIVFEPKYKTYLEESSPSQYMALIALLKSKTVADRVIEQLGEKLEPEEPDPVSLLDKVQVGAQGDLIGISVRSTNPQTATYIADAWADSYESYINALYSGVLQSPEEFAAQADAARKDYEGKQKTWEDFVSKNRVDEINRNIADHEMLYNLRSLRDQIEANPLSLTSAAANSLALILLQTQAYTGRPAQPQTGAATTLLPGIQVSLGDISTLNVSLDDVDALIDNLETRSEAKPGQSIVELRQGILQLRGELEREQAKQWELATSRDIAREAYETIAGKVVEAEAATQVTSIVVRRAEPAAVPASPVAPNRMLNIAIALIAGLVVSVVGAFGVEYFKKTGEKPGGKKDEE